MHQVDSGVNFVMVVGPINMIRGSKWFPSPSVCLDLDSELENRIHQRAETLSEPERHLVLYIPRAMGY